MKIVHVVEATATGTLSMVCASANAMAAKGHQVAVVYSRRPETPIDLSPLFHQGVALHELPMRGKSLFKAVRALRGRLEIECPDVVHLHSSFAGFLGRIAMLGTLPFTRVFYSPHCISLMRTDITVSKLLYWMLEFIAGMRTCTYVACSGSERAVVRQWLGRSAALLENAFDAPSTRSRSDDPGRATVVSVGGIRRQKDPALFAHVARSAKVTLPEVSFVWIGDGDEDLRNDLQSSGVTVTGWVDRSSVLELLESASVYLSTASWEGMPVSVIEAMSLGIPVVATACSGNVDVVRHEDNGFLFDRPSLALEWIERCAQGSETAARAAAAAREEVRTRFSMSRFAAELERLYHGRESRATP